MESSRTDIAALAAASVAVVVSLVIAEGPFSLVNVITTITVVLLIVAYACNGDRTWMHSAAIAAVIGLAITPTVGFLDEASLSGNFCAFVQDQFRTSLHPPKEKPQSLVPAGHLAIGWLVFFAISFAVLKPQRKG